MVNLSNFRSAFLDAQNKAEFSKAGKSIVNEFRYLQMEEKMENYHNNDVMTVFLMKDSIIFFWRLNNYPNVIYLNKNSYNWYEYLEFMFLHERIYNQKIKEKISIYDSKIIKQLAKRITDLFTGKYFSEMPEIA